MNNAGYIDKDDPPFLIIHGEKDELVPVKQSRLLSSWLNVVGVQNELIVVKDAPHFGAMFDVDEVREKVIAFLKKNVYLPFENINQYEQQTGKKP